MTITVLSLSGRSFYLPYYKNMRCGQFAALIAAPALGSALTPDGSLLDRFVKDGKIVFTKENKDKFVGDVLQDNDTLHHSICMGPVPDCLLGNGSLLPPTQYQLILDPSSFEVPSACKRRRVESE
jgi:hypothetical protein